MMTFEFNIYKITGLTETGYSLEFIKTINISRAKQETAENYIYSKFPYKNHFIERN